MIKSVINVEGMSCEHCVKAVKGAVGALPGVSAVSVDLEGKTVTVEFDSAQTTLEAIKHEITELEYDVIE